MATADEYAAWIVKNADKKGSPEFDTVAQAYKAAKAARTPDALDDPNMAVSGMGTGSRVAAGMGKAFTDLARGAGERLGVVSPSDIDQSRATDAPLMSTGAGVVGNVAGNLAALAPAALIPGVNTVVGGAALGAVSGALEPTGTGESAFGNTLKDAALGGGASALVRTLPAAVAAAAQPFYQSGRQRLVGDVLARNGVSGAPKAASGTPGWNPTLAEASQDPRVSIFQRGAESMSPITGGALAARRIEQNGAAVGALQKLAGTPEEQKLAVATRDLMASPLYEQASRDGIDQGMAAALKPQIDNLMERPAMQRAADVAKRIFGEQSISLAKSGDVKGLQYMKQALDDIIEGYGRPGNSIGKNELRSLQQTRSDLLSTMQDIAPNLRAADQQYATFSRPINESKVAREMQDRLVPALMDANPNATSRVKGASFAQALRDLDEQIPRMTGYPGSTVENTMSPGGNLTLSRIRESLANRAWVEDAGIGGSKTSQNISSENFIRRLLGPLGAPQGLADMAATSTIGRSLQRPLAYAYQLPEQEIQSEIAKALLNPKYASELVSKASSPMLSPAASRVAKILAAGSAPTAIGATKRTN